MPSKLVKFSLTFTALAPIFVVYAIRSFSIGYENFFSYGIWYLIVGLISTCLCIKYINWFKSRPQGSTNIKITSVSGTDNPVLGFFLAYMLPILDQDITTTQSPILAISLFIFFCWIVWSTHLFHFNPVLGFMGYNFYAVANTKNVTHILITKRVLKNLDFDGEVVQLDNFIYMDISE